LAHASIEAHVMEFEWDERKAETNTKKHGVSFHEAATVLGDTMAITFRDPGHSQTEHRFLTFGLSRSDRLLVVAHTARGLRVRIISARVMTRHERKIYEEG
jgi:hypothetical protein